jgi:hypothetical protein
MTEMFPFPASAEADAVALVAADVDVVAPPCTVEKVEVAPLAPPDDPLFEVSGVNLHFLTSSTASSPLSFLMGVSVTTHVSVIGPEGLCRRNDRLVGAGRQQSDIGHERHSAMHGHYGGRGCILASVKGGGVGLGEEERKKEQASKTNHS